MNNQEIRLKTYKEKMIKGGDFLVLHGVCLQSKDGKNIILGGPNGSGKSFIFNKIKKLGLVKKLYDEDLIILNKEGFLLPLGNKSFKGKIGGKYIYKKTKNNNFGKINKIFFINNKFYGLKKTKFSNKNIIKYLIHETYKENNEILKIYKNFKTIKGIETYIIGNNKKDNNFNFLRKKIGIKKKSY